MIATAAISTFLRSNWQAVAGVIVAAVLVLLLAIRTDQRNDAREAYEAEKQASILFAERVRATSESIARKAAELARRVEASQTQISQETAHDYQERIARLRADYDRRLRAEANRANPGRGGNAVPGLPASPGDPDGAAAPGEIDAFACEANTIQLDALQEWLRRQVAVER